MLSIWRLGFYRLMERSAQNWTRPSLMLLVLGHWAPLPAPGHLLATVAIAHCHYWLDESYLRWLCVRKLILGFMFGQTKVLTEFPAGDRAQQVNCLLSKHEDLSLEPTSVTPVLRAVNWGRGEVWQVDPAGSLASCTSGIGESHVPVSENTKWTVTERRTNIYFWLLHYTHMNDYSHASTSPRKPRSETTFIKP